MRLLGLDPGLRRTGWGVITVTGNRLVYVADGVIAVKAGRPLAERLSELYRGLVDVLERFAPDAAAVEETFVNKNPASTLKLGVARGVALLAPAERGLPVHEYSANLIKKSVVGVGHADKTQVQMMVRRLLPGCLFQSADAADALAVAICHAHHAATLAIVAALSRAAPSPRPSPRGGEGAHRADRSAADTLPRTLSPPGRGQGEGARRVERSDAAKRKPTETETLRAQRLRADSTDVERLLWSKLRNKQLDAMKFRRQEPLLGFTVDFVCHERALIVELDGGQHGDAVAHDARRTKVLEQGGFRVLRFWNNDVTDNLDGVLETIQRTLSPEAPSPRPSPRGGEGEKGEERR
jgi:crossover junction endodeoxyribonuclease RuvC